MVELAAFALSIALAAQQPATPAAPTPEQPAATDPALATPPADPLAPPPDATALPPTDMSGLPTDPGLATEEPAAEGEGPTGEAATQDLYGFESVWRQGDFVARGTLIILAIMSLASWYIILTKVWDQSRLRRQFLATERGFWSGRNMQEGINTLTDSDNAFRTIAEQGLNAAKHHEGRLTDQIPLHEWITQSLQRSVDKINNDLQGGLSFLATTGSTAPFVGLFGTVWGIYHALIAIGSAGQASIDKVAGPVGEALIMTAIGLAVAVPAVLGYNWLLRRNKALFEQVRYFATDVQNYLISGARVETAGAGATAAAAQRSK